MRLWTVYYRKVGQGGMIKYPEFTIATKNSLDATFVASIVREILDKRPEKQELISIDLKSEFTAIGLEAFE